MSNVVSSPDFIAITTNVGVLLAAIGTVIAAIWSAVKKIKTVTPEATSATTQKVLGGMIVDHTAMMMWTESNKDVVESNKDVIDAIHANTKEMMELRFAVIQLKDKTR